MKRKRSIHIICFTLVILIVAMNMQVLANTVVKVTSLTLNKTQDTLSVGEVDTLTAIINPTDATNQNVTWTTSDSNVVNVLNGTIQAVKQGAAVITAISNYDSSIRAYSTVIVNNSKTTISLDKTSDTLTVGGTDTLTATVLPVSSTSNNVIWTSTDSNIVKVVNGTIIGVKAGAAVISATTADGSQTVSCYVEVNTPIITMILSKTTDTLKVGGTDTLIAVIAPANATNKTVYWSSSDPSIVQVNGGILIGLKEGFATITATTADGSITQACSVTVGNPTIPTTSLILNKTSDTLKVGETDTLTANVLPINATSKTVVWSSSNSNVATVDNGVLIGVREGTSIITATSSSSTAVCIVTVTNPTKTIENIRLGGIDRYETSSLISKQGWKGTSSYAIISTGEDYPDALSATPLAKKYNAPILLTEKDAIPQSVLTEIKRLNVAHIFIVGGTGVVSQAVENQLKALNITTERLGGADRFETSIKIADKLGSVSGKLMVANAYKWEEALSASTIAANAGIPIILSDKDTLPASIKSFITKNSYNKTYILGDTDLISDNVANSFPSEERIVGSNQYERNINILKKFEGDIDFTNICVSTGKDFPDALSGSSIAASISSAIILVDEDNLKDVTESYIKEKLLLVNNVYVFGGQGVLSDTVINKLFER